MIIKRIRMKIKIKNKLEGSKKVSIWGLNWKKITKRIIKIKSDKTIHRKFRLKDEIENQ